MIKLIFYFFAATLVFSSARVITVRNPVHAALFLVLAFFSSAVIWLLLQAEFLAIVLVLVYVGAVMVLFLFVVMMLDINLTTMRVGFARYLFTGILVGFLILVEMFLVLDSSFFHKEGLALLPSIESAKNLESSSNTFALAQVLYTNYLYPFEIAAVILLVSMVAAIALTMRRRAYSRNQNPAQQVEIKRTDRVRLVKMPSSTSAD